MKSKILKRDYYTLNDNRTTSDFGFKKSLRIKPVSVNKKNTYYILIFKKKILMRVRVCAKCK